MEQLLQALIIGLSLGATYSIIAMGFVLISKATGVLNIAQGDLVMFMAYVAFFFAGTLGLPFWAATLITMAVGLLMGIIIERLFLRPMVGQPLLSVVMITFGLAAILTGLVLLLFGPDERVFPRYLPEQPIVLGPFKLPTDYAFGLVFTLVLLIILVIYLQFSKNGLAMRATAENQQVAQSLGMKVGPITASAWAISCLTAAAGGIILGTLTNVNLAIANGGFKVFPAVIVGGLESLPGGVIGGLIVGLVESLSGTYIDPFLISFKQIAPFVVLMIIMMVRPYGLFGLKRIERI